MKDEEKTNGQLIAELKALRLQNEKILQEADRLRSSEERYRNFVENAVDGCAEYDLNGLCTFCNKATHALMGCSREEYVRRRHRDRFRTRDEGNAVRDAFKKIYEGGKTANLIFDVVCTDKSVKTVEASVSLIRDAEGNAVGFQSIVRDLTERKKMEDERERYRNFVDNLSDGCYEFDLEGNIIFCNDGLPRIFGYTRSEFLQLDRYKRHISPDHAKYVFRLYDEMYKKSILSKILQYKILRKDGEIRDFETSVSLIQNQEGLFIGYRGIARDITDRKKMEREKERYQEFVEKIDDACAEYDLKGTCTFCNEATSRIFGYPREKLLKLHHHERYPNKEESDKIFKAVHETYEKNLSVNYVDANVLCSNGKVRLLETSISLIRDPNGLPAGFRSVARDVTERRKMERELARYRDFVENIEDSCAEFDLQGRCIFCNEAAHRMMGYSRKEFMQLRLHERYASDDEIKTVFNLFNEVYRTGTPAQVNMFSILCKDGSTKTVESSVTLIRDATGAPAGFRSIGRDVTARNKMEKEQAELREQLSQARKMEAIGTLAGGVAHDFNNLLMGIQGYASLMLLDTEPVHSHYSQLKAIESHVKSGADLTRQLLGYARGGRYEVKPVNLNDIIEKSAHMFGRTKKEIVIHRHYAENLWTVDADHGQIEQVILNLLVNAWHAMPGGGEIYIMTKNVALEKSHVRSLEISTGPYVKITVKDTGIGMDEMTRERLFEPFFTTKQMGTVRGTGLGLASVYGIIKGHKGAINVESQKGQGATFNIYLPASFNEIAFELEPETAPLRGRETVLLVDDEKGIIDVIGEMIQGLGYRLMTAQSGEEAVETYRMQAREIDLVIMDMIMPGMSGGTAIDAIRQMNPHAKIILSSGYSLSEEAQAILNRGGDIRFIQKPFQLSDLSQKIREVLDCRYRQQAIN